jgi:hypothetical protein
LALLGSRGPWTDEMIWRWDGWLRAKPVAQCPEAMAMRRQAAGPLSDDEALIRWVMEGVPVAGNPADGFPADGTLLVYSTWRPAEPPDGSLRLSTINHNWLNFFVFAIIAAVGVLMVTRPVREKFAVIAAAAIALILWGVFAPTFAVQVLGGAFTTAVVLVLLLWLAALVLWGTQRGRSFLAALISGRRPEDVVVRPITPPPPPPSPAALGEAPSDVPDADSGSGSSGEDGETEQAPPGAEDGKGAPADKPETADDEAAGSEDAPRAEDVEPSGDKPRDDASPEDEGTKPEGGRTDA